MLPLSTLKPLFDPRSIAVIGASNKPLSIGFSLINNLFQNGFSGNVYPVNPNYQQVYGLTCYPTIFKVPEAVDMAIIATPADTVPDIIKHCGQSHVKSAIIISSGFKEIKGKGDILFTQIQKYTRQYQMRILGPNCLGLMIPGINLNATFAHDIARPGHIAFISQSGALGTAILDWSLKKNVGFSLFASVGEMADINFNDILSFLDRDAQTKGILLYIESLPESNQFLKICRQISQKKPVIVFKSGKTIQGAKAALSHTGNLTGNSRVFTAAFREAGILQVDTISQLFSTAKILEAEKIPQGRRLAIITNAGGAGVIATDYLQENSGCLANFQTKTINKLNDLLPDSWSHNNPVDILGDADPTRFQNSINCCLEDENVDALMVVLTPQYMTDPDETAQLIVQSNKSTEKPLITVFMGGNLVTKAIQILENNKIPNFSVPESAIQAFLNLVSFSANKKQASLQMQYEPIIFKPNVSASQKIIRKIISSRRTILTEDEAKTILFNYGLPVPEFKVVKNINDAVKAAAVLGYPVVIKILSPDILHKTDVSGYKLNLINEKELIAAYTEIETNIRTVLPDAKISGFLVEKMISKRYELLLGSKTDEIFGPVIVFGTGGIMVEYYNDTSLILPPLDIRKSMELIRQTKIYQLLQGYRKNPRINMHELALILCKFSRLVTDFPEIKEIDINPLAFDRKGGKILDAKIILNDKITSSEIYWGKSK